MRSSLPRSRAAVVVLVVLALVAAGCGGDDEPSGGDGSTPAPSTAAPTTAGTTDDAAEPVVDPYDGHTSDVYDQDASWICRPDLADDSCRDLDVTRVEPDGSTSIEPREPAAEPEIDCFYIYPTVSDDPGTNSDLEVSPDAPEVLTVVAQAAPYAESCRVFAPVYRQVTLVGLGEGGFATGGDIAYADVLDAWKTYVSQWNDGRGVILIGHSQGTGMLRRLITEEIDGDEVLGPRLVSAHLFGGSIGAPEGRDVGGTFTDVAACRSTDQTGCVVTWSTYPADAPPVEDAIFGVESDGGPALCTDVVEMLGRERGSAIIPVSAPLVGGVEEFTDVQTRYVELPDSVEVSCETTPTHSYLAVATVDDERPLDGLVRQRLGPTWGLHLVDMSVVLDDLVDLAALQADAYAGS